MSSTIIDGSNPIPLAEISGLPYTDVILAFLVPGDNFNLTGQGGAFDSDGNPNLNDIHALENAGKNVLISVGGPRRASRPVTGSGTPGTCMAWWNR